MIKTILKILGILVGIAAFVVVVAFIALSVFNSPTYAWRILRYGQSDIHDYNIFPERAIENGSAFSPLPKNDREIPSKIEYEYQGKLHTENLDDLLKRTETRAFLIVRDDKLIREMYLNSSRDSVNTSFSSAKSFNSALIGAAIADGYIYSVNDPVIKYIPEIAGRGLDTLTIRDLLLMNSGIHYVVGGEMPFYMAPFGDDAVTYYPPDLRKAALSVKAGDTPIGEAFHYNNFHPLLEGLIIERATGMGFWLNAILRVGPPMSSNTGASQALSRFRWYVNAMAIIGAAVLLLTAIAQV
jgi:hypothetical protein